MAGRCATKINQMEGGLWGLVIVVAAFMIQFLAFGTTASIGVFNIELLEFFNQETVGVSLIGAINFGVFLGSGNFFLWQVHMLYDLVNLKHGYISKLS